MNAIEIRAAISLAFVYVMRMLGLFMVIPVIAIAALEFPDYSPLWVGVAIGGYGLTQAILQIPMGMASDKIGRKAVIYFGLSVFIAGSLIAASADSMAMLTLGRVLQGMGAIAGAVMALAADVTRESQRTKIMAIIGVSIGFSFYLALLLGPLVSASFGLQGIFIITAVGASLCLPMIKWGVITNGTPAPTGDSLPQKEALKSLFVHPQLWRFNLSVMLIHLLITSFFVQVPSLLNSANFELQSQWKIYTPILFFSVILMVALMRLSSSISRKKVFIISLAFMAFSFLLLISLTETSLALHWVWIAIAGILFFAGFNYMEANLPAMVSSIAPAGQKGTAMGLYASFQFFGAFAGGILTGALIQWFSAISVYFFCLLVILLLGLVIYSAKNVGKTARFALEMTESDKRNMAKVFEFESALRKVEGVIEVTVSELDNAIYVKAAHKKVSLAQLYMAIGRPNKVEP